MKLFNNKKAQTLFSTYTYYIVTTFALAVLSYLVIEVAIIGYLLPILQQTVTANIADPATVSFILAQYAKVKFFLRLMPFLLWTGVTIYLIIRLVIREGEAQELG